MQSGLNLPCLHNTVIFHTSTHKEPFTTKADNIQKYVYYFSEKIRFHMACKSSALQTFHMKCHTSFSEKNSAGKKNLTLSSATIMLGTLWVKMHLFC